jgi:plasmid stabilization system protein ParE
MPRVPERLKWSATAERDIRRIWAYYAAEVSADTANKIVAHIRATGARLGQHPFSGRPRDELRPGLRSTLAHPHVIFTAFETVQWEIVHVVHQRRDLPSVLAKDD